MRSTVTELDGNKVKLTVEVDSDVIDTAVDAAFRQLAREVRIPGFRPGKVPRKVLEARIGGGYAREQALRESVQRVYGEAVVANGVDVIAPPEIDITSGQDAGPVTFDAVVEVRPRILVPGYHDLRVIIPSPELSDDDVNEHLDRLRSQFAELAEVDRAAADGDHVTIDIEGTQGGEPVPGLTATDYDYRVGSGAVVPEIDEHLRGAEVGDELEFSAAHPDPDEDDELEFHIEVKAVKETVLPDLDDEFATQASEFATMDELRSSIVDQFGRVKRMQAQLAARDQVADAVVALVTDDPPEAMVAGEMEERLHDLGHRLEAQQTSLEDYLRATGRSTEDFSAELKDSAIRSAKLDLALRAVAEAEDLWPTDDDYRTELEAAAEHGGRDPDELAAQFATSGYEKAIRSDLAKRRAFDWLLEHAELVDEDGTRIDPSDLEPSPPDRDGDTEVDDTDVDDTDVVDAEIVADDDTETSQSTDETHEVEAQ